MTVSTFQQPVFNTIEEHARRGGRPADLRRPSRRNIAVPEEVAASAA